AVSRRPIVFGAFSPRSTRRARNWRPGGKAHGKTALCVAQSAHRRYLHRPGPVPAWCEAAMKLAFVIPAYNEEALIGKCLDSVVAEIARAGVDAQIIVVNNASTDRTGEIARSYPSIRVVDEPK